MSVLGDRPAVQRGPACGWTAINIASNTFITAGISQNSHHFVLVGGVKVTLITEEAAIQRYSADRAGWGELDVLRIDSRGREHIPCHILGAPSGWYSFGAFGLIGCVEVIKLRGWFIVTEDWNGRAWVLLGFDIALNALVGVSSLESEFSMGVRGVEMGHAVRLCA